MKRVLASFFILLISAPVWAQDTISDGTIEPASPSDHKPTGGAPAGGAPRSGRPVADPGAGTDPLPAGSAPGSGSGGLSMPTRDSSDDEVRRYVRGVLGNIENGDKVTNVDDLIEAIIRLRHYEEGTGDDQARADAKLIVDVWNQMALLPAKTGAQAALASYFAVVFGVVNGCGLNAAGDIRTENDIKDHPRTLVPFAQIDPQCWDDTSTSPADGEDPKAMKRILLLGSAISELEQTGEINPAGGTLDDQLDPASEEGAEGEEGDGQPGQPGAGGGPRGGGGGGSGSGGGSPSSGAGGASPSSGGQGYQSSRGEGVQQPEVEKPKPFELAPLPVAGPDVNLESIKASLIAQGMDPAEAERRRADFESFLKQIGSASNSLLAMYAMLGAQIPNLLGGPLGQGTQSRLQVTNLRPGNYFLMQRLQGARRSNPRYRMNLTSRGRTSTLSSRSNPGAAMQARPARPSRDLGLAVRGGRPSQSPTGKPYLRVRSPGRSIH